VLLSREDGGVQDLQVSHKQKKTDGSTSDTTKRVGAAEEGSKRGGRNGDLFCGGRRRKMVAIPQKITT